MRYVQKYGNHPFCFDCFHLAISLRFFVNPTQLEANCRFDLIRLDLLSLKKNITQTTSNQKCKQYLYICKYIHIHINKSITVPDYIQQYNAVHILDFSIQGVFTPVVLNSGSFSPVVRFICQGVDSVIAEQNNHTKTLERRWSWCSST